LAQKLRRYGYEVVRQTGSHIRLRSNLRGADHRVTVPDHKTLKLGTLNAIVAAVAKYLEKERSQIAEDLFER
jgi:predicted RNA binding protein YcfA (HicA-like mRNA interferase family)